jgi:hypothetical protein
MHPLFLYSQAVQRDRFHELESEEHRLLAEFRASRAGETSRVRRSAALVLAALSRSSAAAARRLRHRTGTGPLGVASSTAGGIT